MGRASPQHARLISRLVSRNQAERARRVIDRDVALLEEDRAGSSTTHIASQSRLGRHVLRYEGKGGEGHSLTAPARPATEHFLTVSRVADAWLKDTAAAARSASHSRTHAPLSRPHMLHSLARTVCLAREPKLD